MKACINNCSTCDNHAIQNDKYYWVVILKAPDDGLRNHSQDLLRLTDSDVEELELNEEDHTDRDPSKLSGIFELEGKHYVYTYDQGYYQGELIMAAGRSTVYLHELFGRARKLHKGVALVSHREYLDMNPEYQKAPIIGVWFPKGYFKKATKLASQLTYDRLHPKQKGKRK